ncbi:MAG: aldo/keto reductase [Sphingomonas sp.]
MEYQQLSPVLPPIPIMSMGSWHIFNRISTEQGVELIRTAIDLGINYFDIAPYWDTPNNEENFAAILRRLGLPRDAYTLAIKLWQWDLAEATLGDHLDRSLATLGTDHADMILVSRLLPTIDEIEMAEDICALIRSGRARAWSVCNWEPDRSLRVYEHVLASGLPAPVLIQLPYNLARRSVIESPAFEALLASTTMRLQAANTLEGGVLTGHLERERYDPSDLEAGFAPTHRNIPRDAGKIRNKIRANYPRLQAVAERLNATPAQVAMAFVLAHPHLGSLIFGATRPEHIRENVGAIDLLAREGEGLVAMVADLAVQGGHAPLPFDGKRTVEV